MRRDGLRYQGMTEAFYSRTAIPESCHLGKRVYKKLFFENAQLDVTDEKAFQEDIDTVTWQYTLRPKTILVSRYEDQEREYHEIAVLHVELSTRTEALQDRLKEEAAML